MGAPARDTAHGYIDVISCAWAPGAAAGHQPRTCFDGGGIVQRLFTGVFSKRFAWRRELRFEFSTRRHIHLPPHPLNDGWQCLDVGERRVEVDDAWPERVPPADDGVGDENLARLLDAVEQRVIEAVEVVRHRRLLP